MENKAVTPRVSTAILSAFAVIGGICALASVITATYWFRPDPVLTINGPIRVAGTVFVPGDWLRYEMDYCKSQDIEAEVHYSWIDGVAYAMPGVALHRLKTGCGTITDAVLVPHIPPGKYKLEIERIYRASPLRTVEVRTVSAPFYVEKGNDE